MPDKSPEYDESKIQTLEALEHIRLRSGMYIGRLGNGEQYEDGIYMLLKEIIDNSIDEYIMGQGSQIELCIQQVYSDDSELQFTQNMQDGVPNDMPDNIQSSLPEAEQQEEALEETLQSDSQDEEQNGLQGNAQSHAESDAEDQDQAQRDAQAPHERLVEKAPKRKLFSKSGLITVRDYGRGIPLGKIVEAVSVINTGAKYNDDVFQFSVGLNGVGSKAVNALSSHFLVRSYRDGKMSEAVFAKGKLQSQKQKQKANDAANGTYVEFWPDEEIFGQFAFRLEYLQNRLFHYACLNPHLKLRLRIAQETEQYLSKNGLQDLLQRELPGSTLYPIVHCETQRNPEDLKASKTPEDSKNPKDPKNPKPPQLGLEFAFTHTQQIGETHFSFVNGQFTVDGGIHLQAFREGFTRGINDYYKTSYTTQDIRDGLVAAIKVQVKNPIFESQTKNKLGNTELRAPIAAEVRKMTAALLYRNEDLAQSLNKKIKQNEKLRKELASVRKMMRDSNKRLALNIPELRDCKYHRNEKRPKKAQKENKPTMVFLTEGQSATGSLISCRDVYYQALFSLRGKPWNCFGRSEAEIYQNEELFHLLKALGLENDTEQLRYDQVIIATDADDDGYHIRNLLMTFFLHYFEELVQAGHLFILETPLFRVRNNKETHYCYNEEQKNHWLKKLSKPETTRFKGLGEISPKEFGQFIGSDMRLIPVNIEPFKMHTIPEILEFYMGKNTVQRKKFIIDNLKETSEVL